jgi:hypothetical protein
MAYVDEEHETGMVIVALLAGLVVGLLGGIVGTSLTERHYEACRDVLQTTQDTVLVLTEDPYCLGVLQ